MASADLVQQVAASIPGGGTRLVVGTVNVAGGVATVTRGGVPVPCLWADPIVVAHGDHVLLAMVTADAGQTHTTVLTRLAASPRPDTGVVSSVPAGSDTIAVTADGATFDARFAGSAPAVGDRVLLLWQSGDPVVIDKVGVVPAPPSPAQDPTPAPPPPPAQTGREAFPASSTYTGTGAGIRHRGAGVFQGSWGGYTWHGSWYYGSKPAATLGDRTVTRARFRLPARLRVGNYNAPATVHVWLHPHKSPTGGVPPRTHGPIDVTRPPNGGPVTVELPVSWGQQIALTGGGISISGEPYAAVNDLGGDPASGLLTLDWKK